MFHQNGGLTLRAVLASVHSTRYPAHATSQGKVLLAFADPKVQAACRARPVLLAPTDRTLSDPLALSRALEQIAAQGFVVSVDEWDSGAASIAVPIFDAQGRAVAAINASGYSGRQTADSLIAGRLGTLRDCARTIAARLDTEHLTFD